MTFSLSLQAQERPGQGGRGPGQGGRGGEGGRGGGAQRRIVTPPHLPPGSTPPHPVLEIESLKLLSRIARKLSRAVTAITKSIPRGLSETHLKK